AGGRRPHATSHPNAVASGAAASEGSPRQRRVAQRRPGKGPVYQARPHTAARLHAGEPWAAEPWAGEPWATEAPATEVAAAKAHATEVAAAEVPTTTRGRRVTPQAQGPCCEACRHHC